MEWGVNIIPPDQSCTSGVRRMETSSVRILSVSWGRCRCRVFCKKGRVLFNSYNVVKPALLLFAGHVFKFCCLQSWVTLYKSLKLRQCGVGYVAGFANQKVGPWNLGFAVAVQDKLYWSSSIKRWKKPITTRLISAFVITKYSGVCGSLSHVKWCYRFCSSNSKNPECKFLPLELGRSDLQRLDFFCFNLDDLI